jgi:tetratricopeptide (TPR) repeat protein
LVSHDPGNAGWQRDLAVALGRVGEVLTSQGQLEEAQKMYLGALEINRRLASHDPGNAGWQRDLAMALGRVGEVLTSQGRLEEARRLKQSPEGNLPVAAPMKSSSHEKAEKMYLVALEISRRLASQDPSNAGWQRDLAAAYGRVGEVLTSQGRLEEAQHPYLAALEISQQLASQDPSNAGWQRDLAAAYGRAGENLASQGRLEEAQYIYLAALEISQQLASQDPSNAGWQQDLKVMRSELERIEASLAQSQDPG